ncbi:MAG TPA: hypothetical protein PLI51_06730 [bacterium]|nr:hypothetical protein [bacterium]HPQ66404.1 hypothetical protein [bacterium]
MEEQLAIGWGYKFLKGMLILLLIAVVVFVFTFVRRSIPPDLEGHREELELLQEAYNLRVERLTDFYQNRIESAPNEVLSVKYQQEKSEALQQALEDFYRDRRAVVEGEEDVVKTRWETELELIDVEEIRARLALEGEGR